MAERGSRILIRPARPAVVAKYLGQLWLPLAAALLVPLAVALVLGETDYAWRKAAVSAVILGLAVPAARLPAPREVYANEALVVVALVFVTSSLAVTWPFTAFGLSWIDALFEAVSAITTTGLTTVGDVAAHGPAFLFARAWIQWYAGFLILVVGLALMLPPGLVAKRFAQSGFAEHDVVGGARVRAQRSAVVYVVLTLVAFGVVLATGGLAPFEALLHVFTAVSTAGFSTRSDSIAGMLPTTQAALMLFSLAGAVAFSLYHRLGTPRWHSAARDPELLALLVACLGTAAALTLVLGLTGQLPWSEAWWRAPLLAVSAQSTTGFEPIAPATLDPASKLVLTVSMFVGGDIGSTAGGIKILRLIVIVALLRMVFMRTALPPHAVTDLRIAGHRFSREDLQTMAAIVLLFILMLLASWFALLLLGVPGLDALFESASALGTVGLSAGVTAPDLDPLAKLVLCLDMLAGRVEVIALLVIFYPATWREPRG